MLGKDQILARFKGDVEVVKDISEEEGEEERRNEGRIGSKQGRKKEMMRTVCYRRHL